MDVEVLPLIASELESQAAQALRQLMTETQTSGNIEPILLEETKKPVFAMTRGLFPEVIGEPNVAGCASLQDYMYVQPAKVAGLSLLIGRRLENNMLKLAPLGVAALLMNIGYAVLPNLWQSQGILDKQGPLNETEFQEVKRHSSCGAEIIKRCEKFGPEVIEAIQQHHERWDGSGYPQGLKGKDISLFARIIAITDTYYALVSERPYRKAFLPHEAIEFVMAYGGELFDPELVQLFSKEVPLYPTGVTVKLNSGEVGIISGLNLGIVGRPIVRIIYDDEAQPLKDPYDIDLKLVENQKKLIVEVLAY
jgi:HD-GYP domain-containing protein (c-di-GMP phosphodiesterase class II)